MPLTMQENILDFCSVYVLGLTDEISSETLDDYFSKFGCIENIIWNRFQRNQNCSKWAIVTFSDVQSAQSVIHEQDNEIGNLCISVYPCKK